MHIRELFDLTGKVALVTGGSRGLGKEMAEGLAEAGARIAITARREKWLGPTAEEFAQRNFECLALECDVSNPDHVSATVNQVLERFGRIDILVNNAGVSWASPPERMSLEKWNEVMAINVTGAFLMARAVGPHMMELGGGKIINIASVAGLTGSPSNALDAIGYSTSKGALISFSRDLAVKWAPHNICVNTIAPGFFPTRMTEAVLSRAQEHIEAATPMGRVGREGELKGAAVFLASRAADYVTGQILVVDGGATAW
ncbi:MAG: SDR family oxidoreductase [Blastocatellia bacterium]|nr:SDR family oxidoreductase [Blastocatellia bacterium]